MKNFIEATELNNRDENAVVIDARFNMQNAEEGYNKYKKAHVKGAYYIDLNKDMASEAKSIGGKHPLPKKEVFENKLRNFGITSLSKIYIYDEGDNASAGRLWFLLKYFNLNCVKIVSGGFKSILERGIDLSSEIPSIKKSNLKLTENNNLISNYEEVLNHSIKADKDTVLIDSRAKVRYSGEQEPLYSKAGHIPHAINFDYTQNFSNGIIKTNDELSKRFEDIEKFNNIIVSCGSGVTACSNMIALDEIGIKSRIYVGSYSDWLSRENEVNTGLQDDDIYRYKNNI